MASKKLTLRINEDVIQRAKAFSKRHDVSLSYLVGRYLETLTETDHTLMPTVKRIKGTITESS